MTLLRPTRDDRPWFRYAQYGRWSWYATTGRGVGVYEPGIGALTEKRLRRKLARFMRRERARGRRIATTAHESRRTAA